MKARGMVLQGLQVQGWEGRCSGRPPQGQGRENPWGAWNHGHHLVTVVVSGGQGEAMVLGMPANSRDRPQVVGGGREPLGRGAQSRKGHPPGRLFRPTERYPCLPSEGGGRSRWGRRGLERGRAGTSGGRRIHHMGWIRLGLSLGGSILGRRFSVRGRGRGGRDWDKRQSHLVLRWGVLSGEGLSRWC